MKPAAEWDWFPIVATVVAVAMAVLITIAAACAIGASVQLCPRELAVWSDRIHEARRAMLDVDAGCQLCITTGGEKMIKTAATSLSLDAGAQDERQYTDGPVTDVTYIRLEYGRFEEYIDWLNSTWKPTMEAMKKAGLIIDYKVFTAIPKSADQPNIFRMITFKNMAALDKGVELEAVAKEVIGSTEVQNKARVGRNEYRRLLGSELIRELILK